MMKVDLTGKVALVTGAARNIGKAIADVYADNGARVIYADILFEQAKEAAAAKKGCKAVLMDVTDEQQVETVVAQVVKEFGRIDILVNNAGLNTAKHRVNINQFPTEEWNRIINVDLNGLFLVSRTVARVMIKQGSGNIINISSAFGLVAARLQCAFVAAKAGVVNLTKAMALELGPSGILVNCIAPGTIATAVAGAPQLFKGKDAICGDRYQELLNHIPLHRQGTPTDVAYCALFLAAPEACYVNGHVLAVDGGWTAGYARDF